MVCTSLGSLLRPLFHFLCSNLKANPVVMECKFLLMDNLIIDFAFAANGKEDDEVEDEVLLIDLGGGGGGGGCEIIVNHSGGLGVSEVRAEEAIEGDDGLQYEKGHWVSAI